MAADDPEHPGFRIDDDPGTWQRIVAEGRLAKMTAENVVRAFRRARTARDERLENELAYHLSDLVMSELMRKVKSSFPNGGRDLAEEVHAGIMEAVFDPESADGKALTEHFGARLHFRFLDAVKRHRRRQQVELPPLVDDGGAQVDAEDRASATGFGSVEVGHALSLIKDERKRLAFTMTMAGQPKREIAEMLGVDPKTLFNWVTEVREFLKRELNL